MTAAQTLRPAAEAIDHLLLGTRDLDAGIEWVARKTGVTPVVGGSHPGRGTRNALIAFQRRRYLEIIAPDPAQPPENLTMSLRSLVQPRLIAWASAAGDLDSFARKLHVRGQQVTGPRDGSRLRPDGRKLAWRTLQLSTAFQQDGIDPIPFFIEWSADSPHPSDDAPKGCDVTAFDIEHPDAARLRSTLGDAGIEANVRRAEPVRLIATLDTPNGRVVLS